MTDHRRRAEEILAGMEVDFGDDYSASVRNLADALKEVEEETFDKAMDIVNDIDLSDVLTAEAGAIKIIGALREEAAKK